MKLILYLSGHMTPLVIFYIIGFGLLSRRSVYDDFVEGAKEGARTVVGIMPTLIGLMVAIDILRASGFPDALATFLGQQTGHIEFPAELAPVTLMKMFFSSAATGLTFSTLRRFGTDSYCGFIISIVLSCTETISYTMSVYFITAWVKKIRYASVSTLITILSGVIVSVILADIMIGK